MKKISGLFTLILLVSSLNAQVYNTSTILNKGKFSAVGAPVFYDGGSMVLGKLGYGVKRGTDMAITMGFGDVSYIGIDFEKVFGEDLDNLIISFSGGAHYSDGVGLDGTMNLTIPLDRNFYLYGGLDLDVILTDGSGMPVYFFIGGEYYLQQKISLITEADLGINDNGNLFGVGLCLYFK